MRTENRLTFSSLSVSLRTLLVVSFTVLVLQVKFYSVVIVLVAALIVVIVLLTAIPVHLRLAPPAEPITWFEHTIQFVGSSTGVACGIGLTLLTAAVATIWPMRMGLRAFRKLEF